MEQGDGSNEKGSATTAEPFYSNNGDGGIRTRVPRRTNAFRVRLITTTLIRLHSAFYYTFLMTLSQQITWHGAFYSV